MRTIQTSVQGPLPESDIGKATSIFSFTRSFGFVWGITILSVIFNSQFNKFSIHISDVQVRAELTNGGGYIRVSGRGAHRSNRCLHVCAEDGLAKRYCLSRLPASNITRHREMVSAERKREGMFLKRAHRGKDTVSQPSTSYLLTDWCREGASQQW
jgi:hypothetical protein